MEQMTPLDLVEKDALRSRAHIALLLLPESAAPVDGTPFQRVCRAVEDEDRVHV